MRRARPPSEKAARRDARGVDRARDAPSAGTRSTAPRSGASCGAQVDAGVAGLCPAGTTGEWPTISEAEHRAIVETAVDAAGGRVPVVPGAGANDTRKAVALVRSARQCRRRRRARGRAGYYNRPTQEGLYRHFRAMADDGGLPLVLYHIPWRTGVSIDVETIARLERAAGSSA